MIGKENEEREDKSKRNYLDGIKDNLQLIKEKYGSDWIVRVYYHVKNYDSNTSPVMKQLCDLACNEPNLGQAHDMFSRTFRIRIYKKNSTKYFVTFVLIFSKLIVRLF